jgi:excisionase family DNA binding protein
MSAELRIVPQADQQVDPQQPETFEPRWMTYQQAATYLGWSVRYLRNLVSAEKIPVYGPPRSRRFRIDVLDLYMTDRDAAMRRFLAERNAHGQ